MEFNFAYLLKIFMKVTNKKYLLGFSLLACLVMGGLLTKFIFGGFFQPATTYVDSVDHLYMGGGVSVYTQNADAIIIGEVKEVTDPYLPKGGGISVQQDGKVDIKEVLKGDIKMTTVTITELADQVEGFTIDGGVPSLKGRPGLLRPGENVLLFLGTTNEGNYVVFAGPYGKYLIDQNNNVTSIGDFRMSLSDLKAQIQEALKNPLPKSVPAPPLSMEK